MGQQTALITGITGQDGALLAQHLLKENYAILAATRVKPNLSRLKILGIDNHSNLQFISFDHWSELTEIIKKYIPAEIYHLAAMSHVGQSHESPNLVFEINSQWTLQLLNAIDLHSRHSKLFFASSCEIFKNNIAGKVSEQAEKKPTNPYGISKLSAHLLVQYYRDVKNIFACNGILFNHESEIRDDTFVSKKICREVARLVKYGGKPLYLGNIEAKKDWGYAPDYVPIFQQILQHNNAEDFVIATGELHSVKDMVNCAFMALDYQINWHNEGLNYQAINQHGRVVVGINEQFFRPLDNRFLIGDSSKAQRELGIKPLTPFSTWVKSMTISEYNKLT